MDSGNFSEKIADLLSVWEEGNDRREWFAVEIKRQRSGASA